MKAWFQRFMYGRYGQDNLGRFLTIVALILCIISIVTQWTILSSIVLVLLIYSTFRMFSRNSAKRAQENYAYLRIKGKVTGFFSRIKTRLSQSKTHRFYKCPSCKQSLRVPKGKGRVVIHCPKCHTSFERKT